MIRYIGGRLLHLIPILLGISILSFLLMHSSSVDAVDIKYERQGGVVSEELQAQVRAELNLDKPFPVQYGLWLKGVVTGDMGDSYISGKPVFATLISKLPATLELMLLSLLMTVVISLPLGILAAVKQNRIADYLIRAGSFFGNSMPNFFVALLLMYFFGIVFGFLPVIGTGTGWQGVILPALTLAISMSAKYTRQVRAAILEQLNQDYVMGARSRGVRERSILSRSVLKSAMSALVSLLAYSIGSLLGGTAVVEQIFMWDGVGKMAVDAVIMRDYPIVQAYIIWMAFIYVLVNLVSDILYRLLDPRVQLEVRKEA